MINLNRYHQAELITLFVFWVEIRISNGLHLFQKNLSYPDLVRMVEKLEGYAECYRSESFYYVRDFTDMRLCSRVLSIIRERLHREPRDGDVFIVMSRNRRIVRMFSFDNRSYSLFERSLLPVISS